MKKSDFYGWREVFHFTFEQTVKQKSYVIFIGIFSIIALLYSPAMTIYKQYQAQKEGHAPMEQIIVYDETGINIDYKNALDDKKYEKVKILSNTELTSPLSFDDYVKKLEEDAESTTMLVKISFDKENESFRFLFVQAKAMSISEIEKQSVAEMFSDYFDHHKIAAVEISEEQKEIIQKDISTDVKFVTAEGEIEEKEKEDEISMQDYFIILGLLMVCMMFITVNGNQIALSIVTEKSSKVLEYLLLNVRPMAMILGKILATIATSAIQMTGIGFCYMISPIINGYISPAICKWLFGGIETGQGDATLYEENMALTLQMMHSIKLEYVLFALLFLILGILLFSMIAALSGASVSKMDELGEAMTLFQILLVAGCYADMFLCIYQTTGMSDPVFSKIVSLCPVTAPFWVPANLLLGKMSPGLIAASFLVMIACVAILFWLTARVYETLLYYNGKALKPKDIIAMAFPKKGDSLEVSANEE